MRLSAAPALIRNSFSQANNLTDHLKKSEKNQKRLTPNI